MHSGEIAVARRLHLPCDPRRSFYRSMPMQHQVFFSNLPYFVFGTLDDKERPWVTVISGPPGFVNAAAPSQLDINVNLCKWDPVARNLQAAQKSSAKYPFPLFSGLGIDFSNARRNKVAGVLQAGTLKINDSDGNVGKDKIHIRFGTTTQESLGNCPKYINLRAVKYSPRDPHLVYDHPELPQNFDGLPKDCQDAIFNVDTMFIATRHKSNSKDPFPNSNMDVNTRGGPKGFVRILPGAKHIIWPDFSGNQFYQSLGNIESDKKLAMVFPNFVTGDMLYVTGDAENLYGDDAANLMPSCNLVTVLSITGFIFVKNGLDIAQQTPTIHFSPYNPPVRYLTSEAVLYPLVREPSVPMSFVRITPITRNVCAFTFAIPPEHPVTFLPGQHVLIDFSKAKPKEYAHMNDEKPQRLNDDFVRSWTISSIPPVDPSGTCFGPTSTVTCTIKLKEEGEITPFLYSYASIPANKRPTLNISRRGINGTFTVFNPPPTPTSPLTLATKNMIFVAGGIGITPFLSFHAAIQALHLDASINLLFSGRNDELLLARPFFDSSVSPPAPLVQKITLFQTGNTKSFTPPFPHQTRRMTKGDLEEALGEGDDKKEKTVYLCGSVGFMDVVGVWLGELGVDADHIKQESFNF